MAHHLRERRPSPALLVASTLPLALLAATACSDATIAEPASTPETPTSPVLYNPDWSAETHEKGPPQYGVVFPQEAVNRIDIFMSAEQWRSVQNDMTQLWGLTFGGGGPREGPPPDGDPAYVDVTVRFRGKEWRHVGFRLKGHASLRYSWTLGIQKLPFRLHFDRFEDDFPGIDDQRFYGFRELSFAPGFSDPSLLREKLAADLFRAAGVPAAATAFTRVYIDFGEGLRYAGLYTVVEVIDDTMVETAFGEDSGNIYKPESAWKRFRAAEFEKKNHKSQADFSDVQRALAALHDPLRSRDPGAWRAGLEAVFDVDHFLRFLAANTAMVGKDSYGSHARNYYLYAHPTRGLVWIPWDHNLSLQGDPGAEPGEARASEGLSLTLAEVGDDWPLIRYLMDDPVYRRRYHEHLAAFHEQVLSDPALPARVEALRALIEPWVVGSDGEQPPFTQLGSPADFAPAVDALVRHLEARRHRVGRYVEAWRAASASTVAR